MTHNKSRSQTRQQRWKATAPEQLLVFPIWSNRYAKQRTAANSEHRAARHPLPVIYTFPTSPLRPAA